MIGHPGAHAPRLSRVVKIAPRGGPLALPVDLGFEPAIVGRFRARVPYCVPDPGTGTNRIGQGWRHDDCPRASARVRGSPSEFAMSALM
jgi:hypothetical protein